MAMPAGPSEAVTQALRQEVNDGCPVPQCGVPLLTWYQFDPPCHVTSRHDPAGMVALCSHHHGTADRGGYSVDQLRDLKRHPNPPEFIAEKFAWSARAPLIRLGSCYASRWCLITLNHVPVLRIGPGDTGRLTVDLALDAVGGQPLARMKENWFTWDPELARDLSVTASGSQIRFWLPEHGLGLDCRFERKSAQEIEDMIVGDAPKMPDDLVGLVEPPELVADAGAFYRHLASLRNLRDVVPIGFRRRDPVGTHVRWCASRHLEHDGRIPILDFVSCRLQSSGRVIEMRDGRLDNLDLCAGNRFGFDEHGVRVG